MYSDRSGSIGQKVPSNWANIARSSAAKIRETAITLNVDNVFNMDETSIVYYASSERVLVPKGTKQVGNLVPVENAKKRSHVGRYSLTTLFSTATAFYC